MPVKKKIMLDVEHAKHIVQWSSDDPKKVWLDIKEPQSKDDPYQVKRAVLTVENLIEVRELIEKALIEIDAATKATLSSENSKR